MIHQVATTTTATARHRLPDVVRRDGRALPRPHVRPLPPDRLRHRRVGAGLHDHLAGAGLRLPRRDPLRRRRAARLRGEPVRHQERDLPARRGQRRALEARRPGDRRRGAPAASHGGLLPRHRRELRVPRLLALLPGRQHRVRGARDRHHGHHPVCRGRAAPPNGTVVDNRTYAPFHQHFLVARLDLDVDGSANTVVEVDSVAPPVSDENPYGLAVVTTSTPITLRDDRRPRLQLGHPARLEGDQPGQAEPARHARSPTSWCPAPRSRP